MKENYTKEYYQTNNYVNYAERQDRYVHLVSELEDLLKKIGLIKKDTMIFDYGCGFGFVSKAFIDLGYKETYSYDISPYATKMATAIGCNMDDKDFSGNILLALDVLEHMTDEQITNVLTNASSNIIIARIPVADYDCDDFLLEVSKSDKTHINCKDKNGWGDLLYDNGYEKILPLNLFSIYDSPGVFSFIALK